MDIGIAASMFAVGAIAHTKVLERPQPDGPSAWVVKFEMNKPLPSYMSNLLEVARGGPKIYKSVQAALNDVKTIGITNTEVQLVDATSFRANRYEWLYPWVRSLAGQGFDEERILGAFSTYQGVKLDLANDADVKLARIIIKHALGLSDGKELEAYLPPVDVLDVKFLKQTDEGWALCQASCSNSDEDFTFLVRDVPEKTLRYAIADHKAAFCKLVHFTAHRRHPQEYTDASAPQDTPGVYKPPVASFLLDAGDIHAIRNSTPGAETLA